MTLQGEYPWLLNQRQTDLSKHSHHEEIIFILYVCECLTECMSVHYIHGVQAGARWELSALWDWNSTRGCEPPGWCLLAFFGGFFFFFFLEIRNDFSYLLSSLFYQNSLTYVNAYLILIKYLSVTNYIINFSLWTKAVSVTPIQTRIEKVFFYRKEEHIYKVDQIISRKLLSSYITLQAMIVSTVKLRDRMGKCRINIL